MESLGDDRGAEWEDKAHFILNHIKYTPKNHTPLTGNVSQRVFASLLLFALMSGPSRPSGTAPLRRSRRVERTLESAERTVRSAKSVRFSAEPPGLSEEEEALLALANSAIPVDEEGKKAKEMEEDESVVREDIFVLAQRHSPGRIVKATDRRINAQMAVDRVARETEEASKAAVGAKGKKGRRKTILRRKVGKKKTTKGKDEKEAVFYEMPELPASEEQRHKLHLLREHVRELQADLITETDEALAQLRRLLDPHWRPSEVTENQTYLARPEEIIDPSKRIQSRRVYVPRPKTVALPGVDPRELLQTAEATMRPKSSPTTPTKL